MSLGLELLSPPEMAAADRYAIEEGIDGFSLMERAGEAVARVVVSGTDAQAARRGVLVLCGPGNNGGDGFVAARRLAERGFSVEVALVGSSQALRGDAATACRAWQGPVADAFSCALDARLTIVDALYGAGLSRAIEGRTAELLGKVNAVRREGARLVAVDLPSGVSGASGAVLGEAIEADETVTFFRRKPGHLLYPGRARCGRVEVADIGIPSEALDHIAVATFANAPGLWRRRLPRPRPQGHKYDLSLIHI